MQLEHRGQEETGGEGRGPQRPLRGACPGPLREFDLGSLKGFHQRCQPDHSYMWSVRFLLMGRSLRQSQSGGGEMASVHRRTAGEKMYG